MRRIWIAVALLVVVVGSAAVAESLEPEPKLVDVDTPTGETEQLSVIGGEVPVEPLPVFERVLELTDREVDRPVVFVEEPANDSPAIYDRSTSAFRSALGIEPPRRTNDSGVQLGAYAPSDGGSVHVYEAVLENETDAESTLAHEFVHVVQYRSGWGDRVWDRQSRIAGGLSHDGRLTYYMVLEGSANYVEHHYRERFMPNAPTLESFGEAAYENASAHSRLNLARYVLGAQYVADTVDSPADLADLHTDPPVSAEQVLHRNDDPVDYLSVDPNVVGEWEPRWEQEQQGELFLRIALRTELNESAAADAAHGWGNDRRITYDRESATGSAWVLRWDDAANATEFEATFDRYLNAKATRNGSVWRRSDGNVSYRVQRLTNRTTVVYLGDDSFVRAANATVGTDEGFVTIEADDRG